MRRVAAAAGVAAVVVLSVPVRASAASLGGFQASASASPVMVWAYEPNLVVLPTSGPQGELDFAYSRASTETGPQNKGMASTAWPGDIVGDGLPGITNNDSTQYPVKSESSAPAGKSDDSQEPQPGVGSASHSDATGTQSRAGITGSAPPAPLPAPLTGDLVHAAAMSSTSTVHNGSDSVSSAAHATAHGVNLLGGLIDIQNVDVSSAATSDAVRGTTGGTATVTGVTVAGHALRIDRNGVTLSDGGSPPSVPVPQNVVDELRKDGITVTQATTTGQAAGPSGTLSATGLVITVDTGPLRAALDAPASAVYQALPPEVRAQLAPVFAVHPKLVFFVGSTTTSAAATTGSGDSSSGGSGGSLGPPASPGGDSGGGAGGDSAGSSGGSGPAPMAGTPVPDAASAGPGVGTPGIAARLVAAPPAAPGVSAWVLGWALAAAGVIGLGARRLGAAVLAGAAAVCANGGTTGIPNLRED